MSVPLICLRLILFDDMTMQVNETTHGYCAQVELKVKLKEKLASATGNLFKIRVE